MSENLYATDKYVRHLAKQVAALQNRVAALERDTHPPMRLEEAVEELVTKAIRKQQQGNL